MLLLILDIDGTLTDTVSIHHAFFLAALSEFDISNIDTNWGGYTHHTDSWILAEIFKRAFDRSPSLHEVKTVEDVMAACFEGLIETTSIQEIVGAKAFIRAVQASSQIAYAFATGSFRAPAKRKRGRVNTGVRWTSIVRYRLGMDTGTCLRHVSSISNSLESRGMREPMCFGMPVLIRFTRISQQTG
jgi:beta-phosphoglucomutase-like phosphatase (HAD superfamily)